MTTESNLYKVGKDMDLGSKIRKYRTMHDMTQNELGVKIGFSSATADSRIRKYESNKMAPKEEIRTKMVEALDVDASALTDINIQNFEDVMQVFFQFEEELGMEIEITEGKTSLVLDHSNKDNELLLSYLFSWYLKKRSLPGPDDPNEGEAQWQYELWKSRFPKDLKASWKEQEQMVAEAYAPLIEELLPDRKAPETISDLIRHFKKMIDAGIVFKADHRFIKIGDGALILSFPVSGLMEIKDTEAGRLFAEFLCDLKLMEGKGMVLSQEMLTTESGTRISYVLSYSPLSGVVSVIQRIQQFEVDKDQHTDWDERMFRVQYEEDLRLFDVRLFD